MKKRIIKKINAIIFFNPVIRNGDILVLNVLKIITAILQKKAAQRGNIMPGSFILYS